MFLGKKADTLHKQADPKRLGDSKSVSLTRSWQLRSHPIGEHNPLAATLLPPFGS